MRPVIIILFIILFICNGCYKKYNVDDELNLSMLDEAYMNYHSDPWYYFNNSFYKDNSANEWPSYLDLFFKIPHEHLKKSDAQTKIKVFFLNSGDSRVMTVSKSGVNDATFKLRYLDPEYGTNFCYSIGAYNDSTHFVIK